jgi:hypothetical protein
MRTCETCGKNIDHKRADARFCDNTCRSRRWAEGLPSPAGAQPPDEAAPFPREVTPPEVIVGLTRAEVAAMIEAALQPIRAEIRRVDQTSASTHMTDRLHARLETLEERLFGEREEGWSTPGAYPPLQGSGTLGFRVCLLEDAVERHRQGFSGELRGLRGELRAVAHHLTTLMSVLFELVLEKLGVDLQPRFAERLRSKK